MKARVPQPVRKQKSASLLDFVDDDAGSDSDFSEDDDITVQDDASIDVVTKEYKRTKRILVTVFCPEPLSVPIARFEPRESNITYSLDFI
jgi:hypothetical protein